MSRSEEYRSWSPTQRKWYLGFQPIQALGFGFGEDALLVHHSFARAGTVLLLWGLAAYVYVRVMRHYLDREEPKTDAK